MAKTSSRSKAHNGPKKTSLRTTVLASDRLRTTARAAPPRPETSPSPPPVPRRRKKQRVVESSDDESPSHAARSQAKRTRPVPDSQPVEIDTAKVIADLQNTVLQLRRKIASDVQDQARSAPPDEDPNDHSDPPDDISEDESNSAGAKKQKDIDKISLQYGKRFVATIAPWPTPTLLSDAEFGPDYYITNPCAGEDDNVEQGVTYVQEYINTGLTTIIHKRHWKLAHNDLAFQKRFNKGARDIRSWFVKAVASHHAAIFGIEDVNFRTKALRREMPAVKALLQDEKFLYDQNLLPDKVAAHLRHPMLAKSLSLLLNGPASLYRDTENSVKTKPTNGKLWNQNEVTHGMIAFNATVVYFVLTGEPAFQEEGLLGTDFGHFHCGRIWLLAGLRNRVPAMHTKLMDFYKKAVFPNHFQNQVQQHKERNKRDENLWNEMLEYYPPTYSMPQDQDYDQREPPSHDRWSPEERDNQDAPEDLDVPNREDAQEKDVAAQDKTIPDEDDLQYEEDVQTEQDADEHMERATQSPPLAFPVSPTPEPDPMELAAAAAEAELRVAKVKAKIARNSVKAASRNSRATRSKARQK